LAEEARAVAGSTADPARFLTAPEREAVLDAIRSAERKTSGEIRVHVEARCPGDALARATRVFEDLGMTRTTERNGALVYLALRDHKFAVIGDLGIHRSLPEGFWEEVRGSMEERFRAGRFGEGLVLGIAKIGERLAERFPRKADDRDELPDEISAGPDDPPAGSPPGARPPAAPPQTGGDERP
jgi:uncharacterized membrane protein